MSTPHPSSLVVLPSAVLRRIASLLNDSEQEQCEDRWKFVPRSLRLAPPAPDLVHFTSVSKHLRASLAPMLWHTLLLGEAGKRTEDCYQNLKELNKVGTAIFPHVRVLGLLDFLPSAIPTLAQIVRKLSNLATYTHTMSTPVPSAIAQALCDSRNVTAFFIDVESLPSFTSIARRIKTLAVDTRIYPVRFTDTLTLAPITVGAERRARLDKRELNIATADEQLISIVIGIGRILALSRQLEILSVVAIGRDDARSQAWLQILYDVHKSRSKDNVYPILPNLQRLQLSPPPDAPQAFQHLFETSPRLEYLDLDSTGAELVPTALYGTLPSLRSFSYKFDCSLQVHSILSTYLKARSLQCIHLAKMRPADVEELFSSLHNMPCIKLTLKLKLSSYGAMGLRHQNLLAVLRACPALEDLTVHSPQWSLDMDWLEYKLARLTPNLRILDFDHPWASQGIRSVERSDFGELNTKEEVEEAIDDDLTEARPMFKKKFVKMFKSCMKLERVVFRPTAEIVWTWTAKREDGKVIVEDEATVAVRTFGGFGGSSGGRPGCPMM